MTKIIETYIFIGGKRDGHVFKVRVHDDAPSVRMPVPNTTLPPPQRGKVDRTSSLTSEIYLRSQWSAEGGVVFMFYRHESLTYADAINMLLVRYAGLPEGMKL